MAGRIVALACLAVAEEAPAVRVVVDDVGEPRAAVQRLAWSGGTIVIRNVIKEGQTCSATDLLVDPLLGPVWGVPLPGSPVIDRGRPGWAVDDVNRVRRDALPDVGAYEFIGT